MAEGLETADGQAVEFEESERDFAAAMAAPSADEPELPAPPKRRVPLDENGEPKYGRHPDGRPKMGPGGPGRGNKSRVIDKPKGSDGKGKGKDSKLDYTEPIKEFLETLWVAGNVIPVPLFGFGTEELRVRLRLQAAVIHETADSTSKGLNLAAQNSGVARWLVERATMGGGGWVLPAALAVLPLAASSKAIWTAPITPEMAKAAEDSEAQAAQVLQTVVTELQEMVEAA